MRTADTRALVLRVQPDFTMSELFSDLFAFFLSPGGLVVLAALDSSMVFFLPAAVDAAVVILSARQRELVWLFPVLATAGSLAGVYVTLRIGEKIGEKGLKYWVSDATLQSIQSRLREKGAVALGVSGLFPPPFPLAPVVLVCGAFRVSRARFLATFGAARAVRFAALAALAALYGDWVLRVIETEVFRVVVLAFIAIAGAGTAYALYRTGQSSGRYREARRSGRSRDAA